MSPEEKNYYQLLEKFQHQCQELIDEGFPYLVVILCHELYRFMYPVEPYAKFSHDNPVQFATEHIRKLSDLAVGFPKTVVPYSLPSMADLDDDILRTGDLKRSTSNLYSELWRGFDGETLAEESVTLLERRMERQIIETGIVGKEVLDMGCGSGRYSIALAKVGAKRVFGVDVQAKSFAAADRYARSQGLPVEFREENVLQLNFKDESFDFVFCNGVLHHTSSIEQGLREIKRVLRRSGRAFLYLYGAGGIFWNTRSILRKIFQKIPFPYTKSVLNLIGTPSNRFIFCDTWYVPVEVHTSKARLHTMLAEEGFSFRKLVGTGPFDLDTAIERGIPHAREMWGDGEHRYLLERL